MNRWIDQIDQTTQDFLRSFEGLDAEQLNWKPDPATWSIAQNIDHLIVINESYFPVIESIRKGTYRPSFLVRFGFVVSFFGRTVLQAVQPDRTRKMKTFPVWEPAKSAFPEGILERFVAHQSELKAWIGNAGDLVAQGVVISSPANKQIVYKLERAFDIIVTHERRHYEQAREVHALWQKEVGG